METFNRIQLLGKTSQRLKGKYGLFSSKIAKSIRYNKKTKIITQRNSCVRGYTSFQWRRQNKQENEIMHHFQSLIGQQIENKVIIDNKQE